MSELEDRVAKIAELLEKAGWGDADADVPQAPQISPQDAKIIAKFEQFPSTYTVLAGTVQPGNARSKMTDQQKRWPRMVYQAIRNPRTGKWATEIERPMRYHFRDENEYGMARSEYEQFARDCQRIVHTEREYEAALKEGWRDSAEAALKYREQEHERIGQAAAERNYQDRNMSDAAKAEAAAAESEHFGHLEVIPEKKRRGRPRKDHTAEA